MKNMIKGLGIAVVLVIGMIAGALVNQAHQPEEKTIVASQIAYDGEMQITYSDGTSETIWVTLPGERVEVSNIITEPTENFHVSPGEIGIEFTDGSWASVNPENNYYEFQPYDMGDWSYEVDSQQDFEKIIMTYINCKNNQ